jgi:hypothetical protein
VHRIFAGFDHRDIGGELLAQRNPRHDEIEHEHDIGGSKILGGIEAGMHRARRIERGARGPELADGDRKLLRKRTKGSKAIRRVAAAAAENER